MTANFCAVSERVLITMTLAAASSPEKWYMFSAEKPAERNVELPRSIPFWKTTPPTTTEMDVASARMKPWVAVAVAVSCWLTCAWMAIKGGSNNMLEPKPATSWNPTIRISGDVASR